MDETHNNITAKQCTKCGRATFVKTARPAQTGRYRLYGCRGCDYSFSTHEDYQEVWDRLRARAPARRDPRAVTKDELTCSKCGGTYYTCTCKQEAAHSSSPKPENERGFCPRCYEELPQEAGAPCACGWGA